MEGGPAAQARVDRLREFLSTLKELEGQGIVALTPEQRAAVEAHYQATVAALGSRFDIDTTESQKKLSWGMRIASTVGALALSAAIVLLAMRFLGLVPAWAQLTVLAVTPLALLVAAEFASRQERSLYYTSILALLAVAAFAANLELGGVIFSLAPTPNALAAIGAFALAVAYHFGLRAPLAVGVVLGVTWVASLVPVVRGIHWGAFDRNGEAFAVAGAAAVFVPTVLRHARRPEFAVVYRVAGQVISLVALLLLSFEGGSLSEEVYHFVSMGAALVWITVGVRNNWGEVAGIGTVALGIFGLIRLADWLWDDLPKWLFFLLVGALGIGVVALLRFLRSRRGVR